MDLGLKGKTVLITGGSKGIGLACAMSFAAEGCDLHLAARNRELLETVRRTIRAAHRDRKSTRLNSSHSQISYAVFCLKKKNKQRPESYTHHSRPIYNGSRLGITRRSKS